jgi:hypothetical protein
LGPWLKGKGASKDGREAGEENWMHVSDMEAASREKDQEIGTGD